MVIKTVTVSSDYRAVIPAAVRKSLGTRPGIRLLVAGHQGIIRLAPRRDIREYRGFLKDMNTALEREADHVQPSSPMRPLAPSNAHRYNLIRTGED